MIKKIFKFLFHIFNILLVLLTIILLLIALFRKDLIEDLIKWLEIVIQNIWNWNYLIAFVSALVESLPAIWAAVPGMNIMLIVWWFFGKDHILSMILVAISGAVIGNYLAYLAGLYYGEEFIKKYWNYFGIWMTEAKYLKQWTHKYWAWFIIFSKFHNVARAVIPFLAGSMKMNHWLFLLYNTIWSIIWATTMILLGVFFVSYYEVILQYFGYIMMGILVLIWIYIYKFKKESFMKYMEEKNKELDELVSKK